MRQLCTVFLASLLLIFSPGCATKDRHKSEPHSMQAERVVATQGIDPKARELLQKMGTFLAGQRNLSVKAHVVRDEILPTGERIQFEKNSEVHLLRPNKLYAKSSSDERDGEVFFDGKNLTLVDKTHKHYASLASPGSIDELVALLVEEYGFALPVADFILAEPHIALGENIETGRYLGESSVQGKKCHHLVFRQENIDWQLWIEKGVKPYPRKFVITYKEELGVPQFGALFTSWKNSVRREDMKFAFTPSKAFEQIDILAREQS